MDNVYTIDFYEKINEARFMASFLSICNSKVKKVLEKHEDEILENCSGSVKKKLPKKSEKFSKGHLTSTFKTFLQHDKNKVLIDDLNECLVSTFKKYNEDNLFSLDEKERYEALMRIKKEHYDDDLIKRNDLPGGFVIEKVFNITNEEYIDDLMTITSKIQSEKIQEEKALEEEKKQVKKALEAEAKAKKAEELRLKKEKEAEAKKEQEEKKKVAKAKKANAASKTKATAKSLKEAESKEIEEGIIEAEQIKEENLNSEKIVEKFNYRKVKRPLCETLFLGRPNINTLNKDSNGNWLVGVEARKSLLEDDSNIDWTDFLRNVKVFNDDLNELNFLSVLNENTIRNVLGFTSYVVSLDEDYERSQLEDYLSNKEILFKPKITYPKNSQQAKLNVDRIVKIYNLHENEFRNITVIPDLSQYEYEGGLSASIENRENNEIIGYSSCFHTHLKYLFYKDDLYIVNMKPDYEAYCEPDEDSTLFWYSEDGKYEVIKNIKDKINSSEYIEGALTSEYSRTKFPLYFVKDIALQAILNKFTNKENEVISSESEDKVPVENTIEQDDELKKESEIVLGQDDLGSELDKQKENENVIFNSDDEEDFIENVFSASKNAHLDYSIRDLVNFHLALKTSQLVILAGSSGTGKTQLPFIYTNILEHENKDDNEKVLFLPVSPSYTEPSDVLGYFKPNINQGSITSDNSEIYDGTFIESETGLVRFLIEASKHKDKLYTVIFDEMNLSQIEYWFSPFMSILEKNIGTRKLTLYSKSLKCSNSEEIPSSVEIGDNVLFIGTINLDETTKELSDRLIDRAIIVNLEKKKISDYFKKMEDVDDEPIKVKTYKDSLFFKFRKEEENYIKIFTSKEIEFFDKLNDFINDLNNQKSISYRTLKTVANYINNASNLTSYIDRGDALDLILKETFAVKIKGSDNSIRTMLDPTDGIVTILDEYSKGDNKISDFKECKEALNKKMKELNNYGYTR